MLLISTLWAHPFSQFSLPLHYLLIQPIYQQLFYEDLTGDSVESLTEVKADNTHSSPLIYQASHLITQGYQLGQARLFAFVNPC